MRERWVLSAASAAVLACSSVSAVREPAVEYEIAYDDNRPADTTALLTSTFEQIVRFRPSTKSFHLLRFRALLAQEGRVRWTIYGQGPLEQPDQELASWERDYPHEMASGLTDGRWVIEDLTERVPGRKEGAIWVGFRRTAGDPRLWSSGVDSENAFVRDSDPARFLRPMPIRKTPMIRLDWAP